MKKYLNPVNYCLGRSILKDDLQNRFCLIRSEGVNNIKELLENLKTKKKMDEFAFKTKLPLDYLLILKRDVKSYLTNPVNLNIFQESIRIMWKKWLLWGLKTLNIFLIKFKTWKNFLNCQ